MQIDFRPRLRGLARAILAMLAQLLGILVERVKDAEAKLMARGVVNALSQTVEALADANPDDAEQIRDIFNQMVSSGPFREGSRAELQSRIQQISDTDTRVLLNILLLEAYPVLGLLTDGDTANSAQMREHLRVLLHSEQGMMFLRSLFGIMLPDEFANTASLLVINLLRTMLEEEGNDPVFAAHLIELEAAYQKALVKAA